jgi:hypothetical protein
MREIVIYYTYATEKEVEEYVISCTLKNIM